MREAACGMAHSVCPLPGLGHGQEGGDKPLSKPEPQGGGMEGSDPLEDFTPWGEATKETHMPRRMCRLPKSWGASLVIKNAEKDVVSAFAIGERGLYYVGVGMEHSLCCIGSIGTHVPKTMGVACTSG